MSIPLLLRLNAHYITLKTVLLKLTAHGITTPVPLIQYLHARKINLYCINRREGNDQESSVQDTKEKEGRT